MTELATVSALAIPDAPNPSSKQRLERLMAQDAQFRDAAPLPEVVAAKRTPGLRLPQVVKTVMEGYAERPALGRRARELAVDPATGRTTLRLLPRFETVTYHELWSRSRAIAAEWHGATSAPLHQGDFVCILGFTSIDYAAVLLADISLGAVNVPLQTSAPAAHHAAIIAETEPRILAAGIDYLDAAVEAILAGIAVPRLIALDFDIRDDDQRDRLDAARQRLAQAGRTTIVDSLEDVVARGRVLAEPPLFEPAPGEDPLTWLFYTSGSTGTPKGAIFTESLTIGTWLNDTGKPAITLSFMPMAHLVGNGYLLMALANGGTSYCAPKSDLSTLFEDLSLVRPTMASIVPRVCELFHHHHIAEADRRIAAGIDPEVADREVKLHLREHVLGGRLLSVGCGSASLAPETYAFMEEMLGMHMPIGYSSTEIAGGTVLVDWQVQRPPVLAYKLADVPELGYFNTDKPHPRGELLVKTDRFMGGYYKRPDLTAEKVDAEGFYRTGDVMAELGPDHLVFVDRCNNVIKLSQGEFVAISRLEALYSKHPVIRQIYLYGTSERAFLLAVIVPDESLLTVHGGVIDGEPLRSELRRALQQIAGEAGLNGYEVPRDFIVETEPFSLRNGLLTEVGKHQRPLLRERYAPVLEALYARMAQDQIDTLRALRKTGGDRPAIETVMQAVQASLGLDAADIQPASRFADLGGDSLSALTFSTLLEEIFGVEVPVGVIISPAGSFRALTAFIEAERSGVIKRASFASVHGADAATVKASDLTLDKFIDARVLADAAALPLAPSAIRTVLLTGATGFLGRFQAISWLERMAETGGKLLLIARGEDPAAAHARVEAAVASDPELLAHFRALATDHLEVIPGDLALPDLGLNQATWDRLAGELDAIVHTGAHVNHLLPYTQLFGPNVVGTAELIRLAITTRLKHFHYVSTMGVSGLGAGMVDEDGDIRTTVSQCAIDDSYANGYGVSKWASEVLLREAHDLCDLPVSVFRPGMILAHSRYQGQLNVPDMFTRLLFSLAATGVAPATFYAQDLSKGRPEGRYEAFSVDYLADAITAIGAAATPGHHNYNLASPYEGDASLDSFVDWMIDAGCAIERIARYDDWVARFETAMQALPEDKRAQSMLAILGPYRKPQPAGMGQSMPLARFTAAAEQAGQPIPRFSAQLIHKYVADMRYSGLL